MTDTTDCDTDAAWGADRDAEPFGLDVGPPPASDDDLTVLGHVEEYDDAPDECTLFPRSASADLPRTTAWLTAEEGSYCTLDEMR